MSEYQYFEFQAIDRPLTAREMATLRAAIARKPSLIGRLQQAGL